MKQITYGTGAPHIKGRMTSNHIRQYILLALIPAGVHGVLRYGVNAGLIILVTCISALLIEFLFDKVIKAPVKVGYLHMLVTGLIMSYCLPPTISWYLGVLSGVLCALLMQASYHFFGKNMVSPIILTRVFMMELFTREMSTPDLPFSVPIVAYAPLPDTA